MLLHVMLQDEGHGEAPGLVRKQREQRNSGQNLYSSITSKDKARQAGYTGLGLASQSNFSSSGVWDCQLSGTWFWGDSCRGIVAQSIRGCDKNFIWGYEFWIGWFASESMLAGLSLTISRN